MTNFGVEVLRLLTRHGRSSALAACLFALVLASGGGCAKEAPGVGPGGNGGASTSSSSRASSTSSSSGQMGGGGGAGGAASTSSSASSTTATSSSTSSTAGTGGTAATGGAGGMSSDGGVDGSDGAGGAPFMHPLGSPDYPAEMESNDQTSMANPLPAGAKGFTASIYPLADVDVFEFDVASAGTSVSVWTSDGMGGCPAGAHTYVRIYDGSNNVLAQDDGSGGCAKLLPVNNPSLIGLPIGKYYVHVESALLTTIPFYVVDIRVEPPSCGDGIVQVGAGEQCDHGASNGTPSDGCSATCQIENGTYVDETEPNDTQATANDVSGKSGAVGEIGPVGDVDWYKVAVTVPGSSITAYISDGFGGCPGAFDSQLSLYSPSMSLLVSDQQGGIVPCSRISPQQYTKAANLPVGTYRLKVERLSSQVQSYYVLTVKVAPPGCGDGVLPEGNKQCDPPTPTPLCSSTCQFTSDFIPETEPNDTQATANPIGTHAGFVASINPAGDMDNFSFTVPGPSSLVYLQTSDGVGGCPMGFSSVLRLYNPQHVQIASDSSSGPGGCALISPLNYAQAMNLPGGTYYARVEYPGNNTTFWEYVVTISVKQPGCGDGVLEAGEQCDDGSSNGQAGDGCSATCKAVAPWEIEPNNTKATATPQWMGYSTWKGHISPVADHDYFSFTLATAGNVTLTTHDVDTPSVCTSDTVLYLLNQNGVQIAMDDDSGPGPGESGGGQCSQISGQPLAAGTYYAWVQHFADMKIIPSYQLDLLVQ